MSKARARSKLRPWLLFASLAAIATVIYVWRGHVGCMAYPECNPLLSVAEMPDWNVPTNPHEKKMYDLAHSLVLPEGVAEPVLFDFKAARLKDLYGDRSVEQQYFEHLCATESRDYVFKRIPNVDGFQIMRPRPQTMDTPEDFDRYGVEEPVGFGGQNDDNQLDFKWNFVAGSYIQPLLGIYQFVELVDPVTPQVVIRIERPATEDQTKPSRSIQANWGTRTSGVFRVPRFVDHREVDGVRAKFGYAWRGMRRERDRELGIAGADFLVFDLSSREVVGLRRTFNSIHSPKNPSVTKWSVARNCPDLQFSYPTPNFIKRVLNANLHVNDAYVPAGELENFHKYLAALMEHGHADSN